MTDVEKLCDDCKRVAPTRRPHQYMVRSYPGQPDSAPTYRCLLCGADLAWERREGGQRRHGPEARA
jgi:hypothetical protein